VIAIAIVGADAGAYVTLLLPGALLMWANAGSLREWFLATPLSWRRRTLAAEPLGRAGWRYVAIVLALTVAISIKGATADALNA
jgi:hypothetical protein